MKEQLQAYLEMRVAQEREAQQRAIQQIGVQENGPQWNFYEGQSEAFHQILSWLDGQSDNAGDIAEAAPHD